MKKMKFLTAILAIVFAAGSAFTPAHQKLATEKKWFQLENLAYDPEQASSYRFTNIGTAYEGEDLGCPSAASSTVCGIYATPVLDGMSVYRPSSADLADIISNSSHFTVAVEDGTLQYVEEEE